jgi:hypothetical protein
MELWTASLYMNRNFTKPVIYANPKFQNPYFLFFGLDGLTRAGGIQTRMSLSHPFMAEKTKLNHDEMHRFLMRGSQEEQNTLTIIRVRVGINPK